MGASHVRDPPPTRPMPPSCPRPGSPVRPERSPPSPRRGVRVSTNTTSSASTAPAARFASNSTGRGAGRGPTGHHDSPASSARSTVRIRLPVQKLCDESVPVAGGKIRPPPGREAVHSPRSSTQWHRAPSRTHFPHRAQDEPAHDREVRGRPCADCRTDPTHPGIGVSTPPAASSRRSGRPRSPTEDEVTGQHVSRFVSERHR